MRYYVLAAAALWAILFGQAHAQSPMLPGFPPGAFQNRAALDAGGGVSFSLTWTGVGLNTAGGTSISYTSVPIGVADANRVVAVAIVADTAGGASTPTAVTIGGISATQVGGAYCNSLSVLDTSIWYASVPTGTTATVAVTYTIATVASGVEAYRIITTTPTPSASATNTSVAQSISNAAYTVPSGGGSFNIYAFRGGGTGSDSVTWTNATPTTNGDDMQQGIGGGTNSNPIASVAHTTATGSVTVSAAITGPGFNNSQCISAAAWGP